MRRAGGSLVRRLYAEVNWRKLRREELGTYRDADGVYLCSVADQQRLLGEVPQRGPSSFPMRPTPNSTSRVPTDPQADGRTVVFFGLMSYMPNIDGVT